MSYTRIAQRSLQTSIAARSVLNHRSASAIAAASSIRCIAASASATSSSSAVISSSLAQSTPRYFHTSATRFAAAPTVVATPGSTIDFNLADIGEGIAECEILKWFIAEGDTIAQFDKVCEVQSDKANVEITSRYDGVVKSLKYKVGDLAKVGKPLLSITIAGTAPAGGSAQAATLSASDKMQPTNASASPVSLAQEIVQDSTHGGKVLTSPAVRRIAKEEGVNLLHVLATGPGGRILKEDVVQFIKNGRKVNGTSAAESKPAPRASAPASSSSSSSSAPAAPKAVAPPAQYLREDTVIPITGINRIMVQTMTAANAIPQLGFSDEICMDALYEVRQQLKNAALKQGVKLSYMPFILKAASLALKQYPQLNAHTNTDCSTITHKASHNLGLAMDTPRGLLVPNVKNCESKSILEIAVEMQRLAKLGSEGKMGREDLTGGTFTISNIGTIGGTYLKPILVVPEVVIGALGAIQTLPRFDAQMNVKPVRLMNISWSADHRVVDGATMARFSNLWKYYLENPSAMLLDTK